MRSYDFYNAFSPEEFQRFARDMVQIREGIVLESFAEGRDMGIDGRAVLEDGDTIIFQAKRMKQTGSSVLSTIQREREKLMKLQETGIRVDRYILVMSEDLLAETKEKVYQLLQPYARNPRDILTRSDLNNLLGDKAYQTVEEHYYQLWIPTANILRKTLFDIVNGVLVNQSAIHYEEALQKRKYLWKRRFSERRFHSCGKIGWS